MKLLVHQMQTQFRRNIWKVVKTNNLVYSMFALICFQIKCNSIDENILISIPFKEIESNMQDKNNEGMRQYPVNK